MTADVRKTYLFLDVDGVLHPFELQIHGMPRGTRVTFSRIMDYGCDVVLNGPPFSRLPALEAVIRPYLDRLQIVVSSSWRLYSKSYDNLLNTMSPDVRACVVGVTPEDPRDDRPKEISTWLTEHGEPGAQVIVLDDNLNEWWDDLPDGSVFLGTDYTVGFSDLDAKVLTKLLTNNRGEVNRVRELTKQDDKQAFVGELEPGEAPAERLD